MSRNSINNGNDDIDITSIIHQAALNPHQDKEGLIQICDACIHFNFSGLCTDLIRLPLAKQRLGSNKKIKLIAVVGFPFGGVPNELKKKEAEWAEEYGAEELDMVPNFFNLYQGDVEKFAEEIASIVSIGLPTRVILDTMKLSKEKLSLAVESCIDAGARGIQTGNGFGPIPTSEHVLELYSLVKNRCSIKVAGGIKSFSQALELLNSGASTIGTSFGIDITKQSKAIFRGN